jgi:hypothetical protein
MIYQKHFSLDEAQNAIADVAKMLEEIVHLKEELSGKGYDIYRHQYFGGSGPNGQKFFPTEMEHLVLLVKEINDRGIELKDIESGLIDFPHIRQNGEEVFLCYRLGEPAIVAWHSLEGGFAARRPLEEL